MHKIVSIEGNIGSGKTTFLNNLKEFYKSYEEIIFLREPVEEWNKIKDENGNSMLQKFYGDQKKYSFSFQMMAFITRLSILKETIEKYKDKNIIIITERSLFTDKYVFAKMLYNDGFIEDVNYQIYIKWFNEFVKEYPLNDIIYVKTLPQICLERIKKRGRIGEENISIDYLINCNNYHDEYIKTKMDFFFNVHVIDGNIDIEKNKDVLKFWIQKINDILVK